MKRAVRWTMRLVCAFCSHQAQTNYQVWIDGSRDNANFVIFRTSKCGNSPNRNISAFFISTVHNKKLVTARIIIVKSLCAVWCYRSLKCIAIRCRLGPVNSNRRSEIKRFSFPIIWWISFSSVYYRHQTKYRLRSIKSHYRKMVWEIEKLKNYRAQLRTIDEVSPKNPNCFECNLSSPPSILNLMGIMLRMR